ncbi:MAG: hypothetical protein R3F61_23065 [Myxococcota bacterium]
MWLLATAYGIEVQVGPDKEYTSIDAAVGAAEVTVVLVDPGVYPASFDVNGREVEVRGAGPGLTVLRTEGTRLEIDGVDGAPGTVHLADLTVEMGAADTEVIHVHAFGVLSSERVVFRGLPVDPSGQGWDPGIGRESFMRVAGVFTAVSSDFLWGAAADRGAQIEVQPGATVELDDCVSVGSESFGEPGGAIYAEGATVIVRSSVFADHVGDRGTAIRVTGGSTLDISDSSFLRNRSTTQGAVVGVDSTVVITGSELVANRGESGAALRVYGGSLTLERSVFEGNRTTGSGAALRCEATSCSVSDTLFLANRSDTIGSAVFVTGGTGSMVRSSFCDNVAPVDGGAVYLESTPLAFANNLVWRNRGGGIRVGAGTAAIRHSALVGNRNANGSAVGGTSYLLIDSIVAGHDGESDLALLQAGNAANTTLQNNAYFENTVPSQGNIQDLGNNVNSDPRLHVWPPVGCVLDDYRLRQDSPLIGRGSNVGEDIGVFSGADAGVPNVDADGDTVPAPYDCDDDDPELIDPILVYPNDRDHDGFADLLDPGEAFESCPRPGRATALGDCNDQEAGIYPDAPEDIAGRDRNCDDWVDPAIRPSRACSATGGGALLGWGALLLLLTRWSRSA